jgi:peptidoglycan/LPS O-acetylase OafA/YrhL
LLFLFAGIIAPAIARFLLWHEGPSLWIYFRTDLRFDNLLYGALVAWLLHWGYNPKGMGQKILSWAGLISLVGLIGFATPDFLNNGGIYRGLFSLVALFSAVLIASAVWCPLPPLRWLLEMKPLTWIGKVSYGLYLWHMPVILAMSHTAYFHSKFADFIIIIILLTIVTISYYKLELPFLRLKNRIGHTKKPHSATESPQVDALSSEISYQSTG